MVVAGLDVGGTKTLAAAVAVPGEPLDGALDGRAVVDGSIVATVRRPTNIGSASVVLASITGALEAVAEAAGVAPGGFAGVGVGIPGLVDRGAGSVRHAVNLGLGDDPLPLAEHLGRLAGAPVVVDNDVNAAAVGAAAALSCTGDLAYLSVGTGVAAGFLLGGRIRRGAHGAAGEIGHLPVAPGGPLCECGQRGCLEAVASGTAIARRWSAGDGDASAASALLAAAAAGDGMAAEIRDEVAGHLAGAVALIAQTVDPEVIVLGGGVAEAGGSPLPARGGAPGGGRGGGGGPRRDGRFTARDRRTGAHGGRMEQFRRVHRIGPHRQRRFRRSHYRDRRGWARRSDGNGYGRCRGRACRSPSDRRERRRDGRRGRCPGGRRRVAGCW